MQINPEAYYPVIYTVNQSGEKVFKPQYIQGKDLTEPQIIYLQSVGYQEQLCQINTQNYDKIEAPCAFEHPELYTGTLCGRCNQSWPTLKGCPEKPDETTLENERDY